MTQFTSEMRQTLEAYLATHKLSHGVGNEESACSIAAFNLAIDGWVHDDRPECMSPVLHRWIIETQDAIPLDLLNDGRWIKLLPMAAGTNDGRDEERLAIIMDHMWTVTLPYLQPMADQDGFGEQWREMCELKTETAAKAAADHRAEAARAAEAAEAAAKAATKKAAERAAEETAAAAAWAAEKAMAGAWEHFNPWRLLERLTNLDGEKK